MNQKLYFGLGAVLMASSFMTSCSDDDDNSSGSNGFTTPASAVLVTNQGNYYSGIDGTVTLYNIDQKTTTDSLFAKTNAQSLGNTPMKALAYGSKIYYIVYGSNLMFVTNKADGKLIQTVKVSEPRDIVSDGRFVYVDSYDGYVNRIDTTSFGASTVKVGANPEKMAVANGCLYVPNSDGMNYMNGYVNGQSVSVVDLKNFTVSHTIPVGLNPTMCAADSKGNVFVLAMGNYFNVDARVQKINTNGTVTDSIGTATMMEVNNDVLYLINAPYGKEVSYVTKSCETGETLSNAFVSKPVDTPAAIAVDNKGRIYITSYTIDPSTGYTQYSSPGYLNIYQADGSLIDTKNVGVGPCSITFM